MSKTMHIDLFELAESLRNSIEVKRQLILLGYLLDNNPGIFEANKEHEVKVPIAENQSDTWTVTLSHTIVGSESRINPNKISYDVHDEFIDRGFFGNVWSVAISMALKNNKRIKFFDYFDKVIKEQFVSEDNPLENHKRENTFLRALSHVHARNLVVNDAGNKSYMVSAKLAGQAFVDNIGLTFNLSDIDKMLVLLSLTRAYLKEVYDVKLNEGVTLDELQHPKAMSSGTKQNDPNHVKIVHKDVKPDNLMFEPELGIFHFIDYAFSILNGEHVKDFAGNPLYSPLEIFESREKDISDKSDIVGLGLIFSNILGAWQRRKDKYVILNVVKNPEFINLFSNCKLFNAKTEAEKKIKADIEQLLAVMVQPATHDRIDGIEVEKKLLSIILDMLKERAKKIIQVEHATLLKEKITAKVKRQIKREIEDQIKEQLGNLDELASIFDRMHLDLEKLSQSTIDSSTLQQAQTILAPLLSVNGPDGILCPLLRSRLPTDFLNAEKEFESCKRKIVSAFNHYNYATAYLFATKKAVMDAQENLHLFNKNKEIPIELKKQHRDLENLLTNINNCFKKSKSTPMTLDNLVNRGSKIIEKITKYHERLNKITNDRYYIFASMQKRLHEMPIYKVEMIEVLDKLFQERASMNYFLNDEVVKENFALKNFLNGLVGLLNRDEGNFHADFYKLLETPNLVRNEIVNKLIAINENANSTLSTERYARLICGVN